MTRIFASRFMRNRFQISARHFSRDENGAVLVFSLVLFILMVMMGGLAVDLMRYEATRTTLQNTLDRSTLAAASLSQTLPPEAVVRDYVAKAGLTQDLTSVSVTEGLNFRTVNAKALADAKPFFLHMIGIDGLKAPGDSTAEQRINNVEIILVLDVSGSMSGTKITNLKSAAAEFVQTVMTSDSDKRISIGIVPYNAQVNVGPNLRDRYTTNNNNGVAASSCFEIPAAMYSSSGLSTATPMPMMAHADFVTSTDRKDIVVSPTSASLAKPDFSGVWCSVVAGNYVTTPIQDITTLKSKINSLVAGGNTSIMTGMKWGLAMMDPAARPVFSSLISAGQMPSTLKDRPFEYTDKEAIKVIVLMTDGEHVAHTRVVDSFKTGTSPIYRSTGDGNYSVFHPTRVGNKFWTPHLSAWYATAWNSGGGVVQLDWRDVWASLKVDYVAWQFYARALGTTNGTRNSQYNSKMSEIIAEFAPATTMNSQLQQSCTLAKSKGVTVYGIAFDAPLNGQQQISQCASGPAYYFASTPTDIKSAFRTIATNISQLRLTQ